MTKKAWNKGFTKKNHPSVMKISQTMRSKGIDNFKNWRRRLTEKGAFDLASIPKNETTAELIGVILGDGNIESFPRCERLIISSHSDAKIFIERYTELVKQTFKKEPVVQKTNNNCVRISLYQRQISKRLSIPTGSKKYLNNLVPDWITKNRKYIIACLKGLFEAEASFSVHLPTYTYNFQFANRNRNLLNFVKTGLKILGYHPETRKTAIRLRKKNEVYLFKDLIKFRE